MKQRPRNVATTALALLTSAAILIAVYGLAPHGAFAFAATSLLGLWFAAAAARLASRPLQNGLLTLASISLCLAAGEAGAWFLNRPDSRLDARQFETLRAVDDPDLGYRPLPNQRAEAEEWLGSRRLFRVEYRFDGDGLRPTPQPPAPACRAVFFVDSYTFGWGLPEDATLPAAFVRATHGLYAAVNFSFNGYGPHQMLRAIETGALDRVLRGGEVDLVVYQGIANHLGRAAGRGAWDPGGPKYVVTADGGVRYVGPFHGGTYRAVTRFLGDRSQLFRLVGRTMLAPGRPAAEDLPLYAAILKQTKAEIARRYGAPLVIVFWDTDADQWSMFRDGDLARAALHRLENEGLKPIPITRIIPDINTRRPAYAISDVDLHPNAVANERIARYLAREVAPERCGRSIAGAPSQQEEGGRARQ